MSTPFFKFKKFTVYHDRCAMKVGTDAVLLGAWCDVSNKNRMLDIGTGTGIISLMAAQRNPNLMIQGIDVDDTAVNQALANVKHSPFLPQISIKHCDLKDYGIQNHPFDLIVSNPPFFNEDTFAPDASRNIARHSTSLPPELLVEKSVSLLASNGILDVILPYPSAPNFIATAAMYGIYLKRRTDVRNSPKKPFKRSLLEFSREIRNASVSALTIRNTDNSYTDEYISLTKDFYINM